MATEWRGLPVSCQIQKNGDVWSICHILWTKSSNNSRSERQKVLLGYTVPSHWQLVCWDVFWPQIRKPNVFFVAKRHELRVPLGGPVTHSLHLIHTGHSWENRSDIRIVFGLILVVLTDCAAYFELSKFYTDFKKIQMENLDFFPGQFYKKKFATAFDLRRTKSPQLYQLVYLHCDIWHKIWFAQKSGQNHAKSFKRISQMLARSSLSYSITVLCFDSFWNLISWLRSNTGNNRQENH